jgi:2-dehydro-3-deoxygalactonokinase
VIAIDWGTTHFRAYRLGPDGGILDQRADACGISNLANDSFERVLDQHIGAWVEEGESLILMSGMVGSRHGWLEVPYVECPATLEDLAHGTARIQWGRSQSALIVPGLICTDQNGVPDVLRGEEVQAAGALTQLDDGEASFLLPGTHSKHLQVSDGVLQRFETHMTGEMFSVLSRHSILGRTMNTAEIDLRTFDAGVSRAKDPGGLAHHLFGVRTRVLAGELGWDESSSYLSGILIGHELAGFECSQAVYIVGADRLSELYRRALALSGTEATLISEEIAAAGLFRIGTLLQGGIA